MLGLPIVKRVVSFPAMRRELALLSLASTLAFTAVACGSDETSSETTSTIAPAATESSTTPATEPSTPTTSVDPGLGTTTVAAPVFPRSVTHAMGTAEIPAEPLRVVALDMSFVDASLALGVQLVGYTLYQDPDGDLPDYFGAARDDFAADAVYLGDLLEPNLEAIAAARPDLILSSKVRHEAIYEQLSALAPTIMSESAGAGWKDNIRLTGEAVGREEVAESVLADYEARAATIGADINAEAGDPVVSMVRFLGLDQFRLYQRASFSGVVLDDAGLARPENQQATDPANFITEVSFEQLGEADSGADWMFYTIFGNEDPNDDVANTGRTAIQSSALWASLPTVQAATAIEVHDETWMSAVGLFGAHAILDDLAETFSVDPHDNT